MFVAAIIEDAITGNILIEKGSPLIAQMVADQHKHSAYIRVICGTISNCVACCATSSTGQF